MRCPNCESGEMSKWHGQHICSNCGYREGTEPLPMLTIVAQDVQQVDLRGKAVAEFNRAHGIIPLGLSLGEIAVGPLDIGILKSPEEIAIMEHNQARYAELGKLRRGEPNTYNETRYRS